VARLAGLPVCNCTFTTDTNVAGKKKDKYKKLYCDQDCRKQCLNTCAKLAKRIKKLQAKQKMDRK
jgi:hypothetical protein